MRDWLRAFRPASFRGVPFKVDVEGASGGRRLAIHPIAYADSAVIEDMGRDPHRFAVTAYVVGDAADWASLALAAALARKGAGALVLPMQGAMRARVASWALSRQKDFAGYVGFDVEFVEEGLASVPFNAMASAGALSGLFAAGAVTIGAALNRIVATRDSARLGEDLGHAVQSGAAAAAVAALATIGDVARDLAAALERLTDAGGGMRADPAGWVSASSEAWRLIGMRTDAVALARDLVPVTPLSPAAAVTAAFQAGAASIAVVRIDHATQSDAAQARSALAAMAAPVIDAAAALIGDTAAGFVAGITGEAALMLSAGQASRSGMVTIETDQSLSAIRIAHDLYGDAGRAGEIARRVGTGDPVFMPVRVELPAP